MLAALKSTMLYFLVLCHLEPSSFVEKLRVNIQASQRVLPMGAASEMVNEGGSHGMVHLKQGAGRPIRMLSFLFFLLVISDPKWLGTPAWRQPPHSVIGAG